MKQRKPLDLDRAERVVNVEAGSTHELFLFGVVFVLLIALGF